MLELQEAIVANTYNQVGATCCVVWKVDDTVLSLAPTQSKIIYCSLAGVVGAPHLNIWVDIWDLSMLRISANLALSCAAELILCYASYDELLHKENKDKVDSIKYFCCGWQVQYQLIRPIVTGIIWYQILFWAEPHSIWFTVSVESLA